MVMDACRHAIAPSWSYWRPPSRAPETTGPASWACRGGTRRTPPRLLDQTPTITRELRLTRSPEHTREHSWRTEFCTVHRPTTFLVFFDLYTAENSPCRPQFAQRHGAGPGHFLTRNGNHTPVNVRSFDTILSLTEFKLRHRAKN
jgi:hypothetical protein